MFTGEKCFREIVYGNRKRSGGKSGNSAGPYIYVTKESLFGKLLNLAGDGQQSTQYTCLCTRLDGTWYEEAERLGKSGSR